MKEKHEEEQPYMSDKLVAFNHIYKEYNIIYHDAAMRLGLSNSEFDTLYAICELGDGCKQSDICRTTFNPEADRQLSDPVITEEGISDTRVWKGTEHAHLSDRTGIAARAPYDLPDGRD